MLQEDVPLGKCGAAVEYQHLGWHVDGPGMQAQDEVVQRDGQSLTPVTAKLGVGVVAPCPTVAVPAHQPVVDRQQMQPIAVGVRLQEFVVAAGRLGQGGDGLVHVDDGVAEVGNGALLSLSQQAVAVVQIGLDGDGPVVLVQSVVPLGEAGQQHRIVLLHLLPDPLLLSIGSQLALLQAAAHRVHAQVVQRADALNLAAALLVQLGQGQKSKHARPAVLGGIVGSRERPLHALCMGLAVEDVVVESSDHTMLLPLSG